MEITKISNKLKKIDEASRIEAFKILKGSEAKFGAIAIVINMIDRRYILNTDL